MITFDPDFSRELCGGSHVDATGEIGLFKILSEGGVAAGIRRIEAVTAQTAVAFIESELEELNVVRALLKNPQHVAKNVTALQEENKSLKKELEKMLSAQAGSIKDELKQQVVAVNGFNFLSARVNLSDSNALKNLIFELEREMDNAVVVLGAVIKDKPQLMMTINKQVATDKGLHAGNIIRELAKEIRGGGGGQPFFASAGGSHPDGLDTAIAKAKDLVVG
jgi:alanyl-tRNA synthetase